MTRITNDQTRTALQLDGWTLEVETKGEGYANESWHRWVDKNRVGGVQLWKREGGSLRVLGAFGDASEIAAFLSAITKQDAVDEETKAATRLVLVWREHALESARKAKEGSK